MIFTETEIKGAFLLEVKRISDDRGFFGRAYCEKEFEAHGLVTRMVQANLSHNPKKGTLRGLHLQEAPYAEAKLVRCTRGAIFDVLVDLRPQSPTYCQWTSALLTADNYHMLYVPEGCAHGYLTLEDDTDVFYQVSQFYTPGAEKGYRWDDPAFAIEWPMEPVLISEKDQAQPTFQKATAAVETLLPHE